MEKSWPASFWDRKGILLTDFLSDVVTIIADSYCTTLKRLWNVIQNHQQGLLARGVCLLHHARPHTAEKITNLLEKSCLENNDLLHYSPDLAPFNFLLFPKNKVFGWQINGNW
jgi:hypothetical protein